MKTREIERRPPAEIVEQYDGEASLQAVRPAPELPSSRPPRFVTIFLTTLLVLASLRALLPFGVRAYVNDVLDGIEGYAGRVDDIDLNLWRGAADEPGEAGEIERSALVTRNPENESVIATEEEGSELFDFLLEGGLLIILALAIAAAIYFARFRPQTVALVTAIVALVVSAIASMTAIRAREGAFVETAPRKER